MKNLYSCSRAVCLLVLCLLVFTCSRKAEAILYPANSDGSFNFPESYLMADKDTLTGVCFSGGGTRALACAIGQMKALDSMNLWSEVDYISSVSGGSWASSIFTYYEARPGGPQNDKELLGYPMGARKLTLDNLQENIPSIHMTHVVTRDLTSHLEKMWAEDDLTLGVMEKANDIWIDAIGQTYLEPFGLYGGQRKFFTLNDSTRDVILSRSENSDLKAEDFHVVHNAREDAPRPYLVMNSTVISPASYIPLRTPANLSVFNYTPLGVGAANYLNVKQKTRKKGELVYPVGGSFIEPFAFGGSSPYGVSTEIGNGQLVTVELEDNHVFRLADAAGTSSSAFAVEVAQNSDIDIFTNVIALGSIIPKEEYWTVDDNDYTTAEPYRFGDGGSLENFGLLSLLQRDVRKLVVFINTNTPIDSCFNPELGTPLSSTIDYDFYTLFEGFVYDNHRHNQVFSKEDFVSVYNQFVAAMHKGYNPTAVLKTTTLKNEWWGLEPMDNVEVHFYYNSRSTIWENQLDTAIQHQINLGVNGIFHDFPLYRTALPYVDDLLVELSPAMTKLLYEFQFWSVYRNEKALKKLLIQD